MLYLDIATSPSPTIDRDGWEHKASMEPEALSLAFHPSIWTLPLVVNLETLSTIIVHC
jgi:hypothetical protein